MKSDEELVRVSRSGHRDAFQDLVDRHSEAVTGIAYSRLGNRPDTEDAVQETFARVWKKLDDLRNPEKFQSWVCGICIRVCKEMHTDCSRENVRFEEGQFGENLERRNQDHERIMEALEEIPEIFREAIMLFYFEEASYEEMSDLFGISESAVNYRLTKARKLLRQELETGE